MDRKKIFNKFTLKLFSRKLFRKKRKTTHSLIEKENKFLLVQEAEGHIRGLWGFPGGGVKKGEEPDQSAIRETKEESGYDVDIGRKIGEYKDKERASVRTVYSVNVIGGDLSMDNDEIMDAKWFSKEEIMNMKDKLRGDWVWKVINDK